MWSAFEPMCHAFNGWAYDYIKEMACALDNYVTRDPAGFVAGRASNGQSFVELYYGVCKRVLEDKDSGEVEASYAAELLVMMLLSCRGQVNQAATCTMGGTAWFTWPRHDRSIITSSSAA